MLTRRAALAVLGLALVGCTTPQAGPAGGRSASGQTLDAAGFAELVATPGVVVLDVRTPAEYAAGHLEGAVPADINGDFDAAVAGLDRGAPYAVYCRSGNRSAAAIEAMRQLGFVDAWHLGGGIGAWQAAGKDVVTG